MSLENPNRREFLENVVKGTIVGAAVTTGVIKGGEFIQAEDELNHLNEMLRGREGDPQATHNAAKILKDILRETGLESVTFNSGPGMGGGPTQARVDVLRDFLTRSFDSSPKLKTLRDEVRGYTVYSVESLDKIIEATK